MAMPHRKQSKYKDFASVARHKITVQSFDCISDGAGGRVNTYTDKYINISAFVAPYYADQVFHWKRENTEVTHMVKVRGRFDINRNDRIIFKNRILDVLTVEDLQENFIIKEMFAFVATGKDGDEGLMGFMKPSGEWMPMVGADLARVKSLKKIANSIREKTGVGYKIKYFTLAGEMEFR